MTTLNLKQIVIDYRMYYKTQMLIKAALCNYCVNLTHSHMKLCLPENPLRHLTHCLSFLCVLTKILCVKYAVTPLNGNAGCDTQELWHDTYPSFSCISWPT